MSESKLQQFLKEKELQHSPTKDKVEALEELKEKNPEKAEELIQEGLDSDSYMEKEVSGTLEIKQGNSRGEKALKQLVYEEYPAHEYTVDGEKYSGRDPTHRRNVVRQLSKHGDDVIDEMRRVLKEDRDNFTLEFAIRNLEDNGTEQDKQLLEHFLKREVDEKTREKARDAIQDIEDVEEDQEMEYEPSIHEKERKSYWEKLLEKLGQIFA